MLDLSEIFNSLQLPNTSISKNVRFTACLIPGYEQYRLGKDAQGNPSLLLSITGTLEHIRLVPIVLEHLTVQYDINCHISQLDGTIEEGSFTILHCTGNDDALHTYFLRVAATVITSLGHIPSKTQVTQTINKLIDLFQAMKGLPRKSIQGLWAELFLIARSRNPIILLKAWHTTPEDRYDFNMGDQRIEVKSVASRTRQHFFSLEQLQPPEGSKVLIASIFVERAGAGTSILDLIEHIQTRITDHPDDLLSMDRIISLTLGNDWQRALDERFDYELAEKSLAFFEATSVPTVNPTLPQGVSEVRFKSDLIDSVAINSSHYRTLGGLFLAALRR